MSYGLEALFFGGQIPLKGQAPFDETILASPTGRRALGAGASR